MNWRELSDAYFIKMVLLASSLGLLPEDLQRDIFEKVKRMSRWEALKKKVDALLIESRSKWVDVKYIMLGAGASQLPYHWQRYTRIACNFKLMEITSPISEEVPDVSIYVYNLETRDYEYMHESILNELFDVEESGSEEYE
jgi:hypothetical protein